MRASAALRASAAPGGVLAGPWVKNELWRRARAVPSLDLPFADYKSLTDLVSGRNLITATRAFSGTFVGSDRLLQSAGVDIPRFTHDPVTGESLGLLAEEQKTNLLVRSEEFDDAAWSKNNAGTGLAPVVTQGYGTAPDGTNTANRLQADRGAGNTAGDSSFIQQTVSGLSDPHVLTNSIWAKSNTGSAQSVYFRNANGAGGSIITVTHNWQRFAVTGGRSGNTNNNIQIGSRGTTNTTNAVDIQIWGAQLEIGNLTSYIKTEASTVTRSADVNDIIDAAIANNIRTLYLEFRSPASGVRGVVSLNDNTANERAAVITSGTDPRLVVVDGGVEQANINGGIVVANARTKVAVRINTNDFSISINGGPVVTDTSGTLPTVDRLMIGRTQAGEYLNAPIARITGWEQLLPDSTLRALAC